LRASYKDRDIVTKLEAFIMFLIRGTMSYGAYTKYLANLEAMKTSGLFANDLDTGNLKLNDKR